MQQLHQIRMRVNKKKNKNANILHWIVKNERIIILIELLSSEK